MNNLFKLFSICFFLVYSGCRFTDKEKPEAQNKPDLEIKRKPDIELFYFDSLQINSFSRLHSLNLNYQKDLQMFYRKRNNAFAWINNSGVNEYGSNLVNLLSHEEGLYHQDCILYSKELYELFHTLSEEDYIFKNEDAGAAELELLLTINFFEYAKRNWQGVRDEELKRVGWFIERKPVKVEALLETILNDDPDKIASYEPVYRQYGLLKKYLQKYNDLKSEKVSTVLQASMKEYKYGDTSLVISFIKKQLYLFEDLSVKDTTNVFDREMESALKVFQRRHGLKEDGIISGKTKIALQANVQQRIQQILINMERCRWVPAEQEGDYLVVNIPAFKLFVYHNDTLDWSCNVIVGKSIATNKTIIFNDYIEYIVFSPYWNIPEHILTKETLPEIKSNPGYLAKHNMEVVDSKGRIIPESTIEWSKYTNHFPYIIRQRPGRNNALGLVKFLFPNSYDIYMHDTPDKSLFGEVTRTFSHGCIRLEEPYKLARFLLRNDSSWSEEKIDSFLNGGKQTFVKLKKKVPVFLAYFTAWVDRSGKLNFREDIYNHDEKMKQLLFSNLN